MIDYDVIVVGAGGSGAPLAARLSEDPGRSVLLLEAGPAPCSARDFPPELLDAGSLRGADPRHPDNWSYAGHLTPDRPYSIARGRILGGSTTINGAYFIRARDEDFERWSADGCREWSAEDVLPFFRRSESDAQYGRTVRHGADGPVRVTRQVPTHPAAVAFHAAAVELGYPDEPDKNASAAPGVGPVPMNVVDGVRVNTALCYLSPISDRANLTVSGDSRVRRVLFDGTKAVGVEIDRGATVETVRGREVVLAAGAIASPHLLMLSGIGPREELSSVGIEVLVDAPTVGKGFSDHPQITLEWHPKHTGSGMSGTIPDGRNLGDPDLGGPIFDGPNFGGPIFGDPNFGGPIFGGPIFGEVLNVIDNGAEIEILQMLKPTEYLLTGSAPTGAPLSFLVALQNGESRGDVSIGSSDPSVLPVIDYHYLSTEADRRRMRGAVRLAVRLIETEAFAPLLNRRVEPNDAIVADDSALDSWILDHLGTSIHTCGTLAFGSSTDSAVDQYGRVRGVAGLRVADTSILPTAPSRGPAATAVMIGELVADFIRRGL